MPRDLRDRLLAYPLCKHRRDRIVPQRVHMEFSAESIPVVDRLSQCVNVAGSGAEPFSLTNSSASSMISPCVSRCHCLNASSTPDIVLLTAMSLGFLFFVGPSSRPVPPYPICRTEKQSV